MRAPLVVGLVLLLLPLAAAVSTTHPASEVPVYAPVGDDHAISSATYQVPGGECDSYARTPLLDVPAPAGSFLHFATDASSGTTPIAMHLRTVPQGNVCSPITVEFTAPLAAWPASSFYDMPVSTSCGQAYMSVYVYPASTLFVAAPGYSGCLPGIGNGLAAFAWVPNLHPSPYNVCDPLLGECAGATQYAGSTPCGDGSNDGQMSVGLFYLGRSCDGTAPRSWGLGGPFVSLYGTGSSCSAWIAITGADCSAAPVGTAMEAVPWGHILP